jgi:hypothetical protein
VQGAEVVDVTAKAAAGFVVLASAMLLLLFFFLSRAFFLVLLGVFTLATTQSLSIWLLAVAGHMLPALKDRQAHAAAGRCGGQLPACCAARARVRARPHRPTAAPRPAPPRPARRHVALPWLGDTPVLALGVVPLSVCICITWAVFRNAWWSWVLQVGRRPARLALLAPCSARCCTLSWRPHMGTHRPTHHPLHPATPPPRHPHRTCWACRSCCSSCARCG